jgi:nitrate/TMAO reductase-like tetraheme cytochrome c subunit
MRSSRGDVSLFRNGLTIFGVALATTGATLFLTFFLLEIFGYHGNPYTGLLFFLVFPVLFVAGLVIIPIGVWFERRHRSAGQGPWQWPTLDFRSPVTRRAGVVFVGMSLLNVLVVVVAAYKGVEYMDSPRFCGQLCHAVMEPEWAGYQNGPHSRVACVQCHIGPGAPWFVKAKLSGLRQVYAVAFNTYSRPIASPVRDLRPARDTCEQCHWPEMFHGDRTAAVPAYADDNANTESTATLRLHVGGVRPGVVSASGIHWHVSQENRIEYIATDRARQVIPWVKRLSRDGTEIVYRVAGVSDAQLSNGERRMLDCVDCHNRPAHTFARSAERAVDAAIAAGALDRSVPFVRREAVRVLKATYASREGALSGIEGDLTAYYRREYPSLDTGQVRRTTEGVQQLYVRNVFPAMRVTWGTYINNLGHDPFPGCFRCHDDQHVAAGGQVITQDCGLCHVVE